MKTRKEMSIGMLSSKLFHLRVISKMLMLRRTNLLIENWTNFILIYGSSIDGTNVLTITNSLLNKNETEKKKLRFFILFGNCSWLKIVYENRNFYYYCPIWLKCDQILKLTFKKHVSFYLNTKYLGFLRKSMIYLFRFITKSSVYHVKLTSTVCQRGEYWISIN
jgi:hypothetical protein